MTKLQFQVLYREFLFRIMDPELLSGHAQGDANALLGQFATLLVCVSILLSVPALFTDAKTPLLMRLIGTLTMEHLLISTTMLAVGMFAVLSWDSTFLDRRDVLVLAPLPLRSSTLFLAKAAASATALSLTIGVLNAISGLIWPFAIIPGSGGLAGATRSFAAYWIAMFAAGAFIYCSVLCAQGLAAQLLPRGKFLRLSGWLQIAAFCLFVSVYFLQPPFASLSELVDPKNQRLAAWVPSYWFLGALQQLNGSPLPVLAPMARRAWIGLAIAVSGAAIAFLMSWSRTLRKIVEAPDIAPGGRRIPLPRFGNSRQTAMVQFSIRSLLRSRQHRLILAFYWGVGFALAIFYMKAPMAQQRFHGSAAGFLRESVNAPIMAATIVMLGFWMAGVRVLFARPLDLRANWIFRITPVRGGRESLQANRRSLLSLGLVPLWTLTALLLFSIWPWEPALRHLIVLGLLGLILTDLCLHNFPKIPFTCSYLPGRTNVHVSSLICIALILEITGEGAKLEWRALSDGALYAWTIAILAIAAILARWRASALTRDDEALQFEEAPPWNLIALELPRDGGLTD